MPTPTTPGRRRRRPEDAQREILDAARELFERLPFHEVTVSAIMDRTTLTRKSFYVYFRDRYDVITQLVAPLRAELDAANAVWLAAEEDSIKAGRASLRRVAAILAERGTLVRALADAARYDGNVERVWRGFNEPVIAGVAERIRMEVETRGLADLDAEATARVLVGMNLYCFFDQLVGNPDADIDAIVDSLYNVWMRTLFGRFPEA